MILVTGASGLIGSHLLYKLTSSNQNVRALYRRKHKIDNVKHVFSYYTSNVDALFSKIEWVECDINDIPKLNDVFNGVTAVYHCAAFVSFEPDKYKQLRKVNIKGTANVVNCCIKYNVKRLCYLSSIAALGHNLDSETLINESTAWNPEGDHSVYAISKYGAELEVWRASQEGVEVVVVNPGIVLGPGYWHGGGSSGLFKQIYKGVNYYTTGITGYVDIWDVINPMIALMKGDTYNEGYILVSENWSFKDFFQHTAKKLGVDPPKKQAINWLLKMAWRLDWLNHKLLGKRRKLSKHMAQSALSVSKYDNSKIRQYLNYDFKPIEQSISENCELLLKDLNTPK
ncbi:MAG: NAD-dependent epimerase/dehydratase family protein [Winogradskyella sp.]|nr:NAD-dependent epimerase/dehydratase family protein [Winogradskyella sp.]